MACGCTDGKGCAGACNCDDNCTNCDKPTDNVNGTNERCHGSIVPTNSNTDSPATDKLIAGALFDFAGFLTSLKEPITFSAYHDAAPVVTLLESFAAKRFLDLGGADQTVTSWYKSI